MAPKGCGHVLDPYRSRRGIAGKDIENGRTFAHVSAKSIPKTLLSTLWRRNRGRELDMTDAPFTDHDLAKVDAKVERLSRAAKIIAENPEFADLTHRLADEIAVLIENIIGMMCAVDDDARVALAQRLQRLATVQEELRAG